MAEWNLKDHKRMVYHHMMDEVMYHEDDIDTLREKLIEKQRSHSLDEKEINRLFGVDIDTEYMREFWKQRVKQHKINEGMTNLEDDSELLRIKLMKEIPKMKAYVNPKKDMKMLDLGSGYGTWTFEFAKDVELVHAVDYINEMIDIGRQRAEKEKFTNVSFFCDSMQEYVSIIKYDIVLLSGVTIYLNDADIRQLLKCIKSYTKRGSIIILRDGTGIKERYIIEKEYSERLDVLYSAIYRTRDEYIKIFNSIGFKLVKDEDMFEEGSPLNRYDNTRLRIYKFVRT